MAVSELLRGIGGALAGLVAISLLALSLAERREGRGYPDRGVYWVVPRSYRAQFMPVWQPILVCGAPAAVCGFLMGTRLISQRSLRYAAIGMALGLLVAVVVPSPLDDNYGRAGRNTQLFIAVAAIFMGGCLGTFAEERRSRGPRGRWE
jgi:hypothetical protein